MTAEGVKLGAGLGEGALRGLLRRRQALRALQVRGAERASLSSAERGLGLSGARTVCFWIWPPQDGGFPFGFSLKLPTKGVPSKQTHPSEDLG